MGKHDHPTLEFVVDRGRLVPAGPYEQEALDTYRPGSRLTVSLHQKRSLPLLKKYWAVLRDVVSNCKTPWASPDEASDAIKLALGITDTGKTVSGQWFVRPGSISFHAMDEAAFRDFFDQAMAILARVTGIDPEELRGRYSHINESEPSTVTPPEVDAGSGASDSPPPAAPEPSASNGDETGEPSLEATDRQDAEGSPVDNSTRMLMEECLDNMLRDAFSEPKEQQAEKIEKLRNIFLEQQNLGAHAEFVERCAKTVSRIIGKPAEKARAREYLMGYVR